MKPRFHLPEAALVGREAMADGASVRTLLLPHPRPVANLLLLTGRADFLEKWAGSYAELHQAGFAIASFDWRGQGGSTRTLASGAGHIDSFDTWLADLDHLSDWARGALPGGRWLAFGHSMGGHLLARWVADPGRRARSLRRVLDGVVLSSPFFGLGGPAMWQKAALGLAAIEVARGRAAEFAWGQGPYAAHGRTQRRQLLLTASRAHFEDEGLWLEARPDLATGGVTWGWLKAFADSEAALEALPLEEMSLPVLMLLGDREHVVDNRASLRIAARLPHVRHLLMADAAHELLRETELVRRDALMRILAFAREVAR